MDYETTIELTKSSIDTDWEDHRDEISRILSMNGECEITISIKIDARPKNGMIIVKHNISYITGSVKYGGIMSFDDK